MKGFHGTKSMNRRLKFADIHNIKPACWTNLVCWAHGTMDFKECFHQVCRPGNFGTPYAYCGKCDHHFKAEQEG